MKEKIIKKRTLLLGMPSMSKNFEKSILCLPSLGMLSIASNLENCDVKVLELIYADNPLETLKEEIESFRPEVIGISAMTFQYPDAIKIAGLIKNKWPQIKLVLGGYHATTAYEEICKSKDNKLFDYIIRREGEMAFNMLMKNLIKGKQDFSKIPNLSYKKKGKFVHNPNGPLLDLSKLKPLNRNLRIFEPNGNLIGRKGDAVETSRGCIFGCKFCCINKMYGRSYRVYPLRKVIKELKDIKKRGVERVAIVDDNITINPKRFEKLCDMIIEENLNDIEYFVQVSVKGIIANKELPKKMKRAGFNMVFLGIENPSENNIKELGKDIKIIESIEAVNSLRKNRMVILGGFIIGNPNDDEKKIKATFKFAKKLKIDILQVTFLTPFPGTEIREELLKKGLIVNKKDYSTYDVLCCNIRTNYLSKKELERIYAAEYTKYNLYPYILLGLSKMKFSIRKEGIVYFKYLAYDIKKLFCSFLGKDLSNIKI